MTDDHKAVLGRAMRGERATDPPSRLDENRALYRAIYGGEAPAYADTGLDPDRYADDFPALVHALRLVWQQRQAAAFADMQFAYTMMEVSPSYVHALVEAQNRQATAYRMLVLLNSI